MTAHNNINPARRSPNLRELQAEDSTGEYHVILSPFESPRTMRDTGQWLAAARPMGVRA